MSKYHKTILKPGMLHALNGDRYIGGETYMFDEETIKHWIKWKRVESTEYSPETSKSEDEAKETPVEEMKVKELHELALSLGSDQPLEKMRKPELLKHVKVLIGSDD